MDKRNVKLLILCRSNEQWKTSKWKAWLRAGVTFRVFRLP